MNRRILILPAALSLAVVTACGGSQGGGGSDEWNTVYDAVPATATAALMTDWNAHDRVETMAAFEDMADSDAGMGLNMAFGMLSEQLGLEAQGMDVIAELGIDLEGDMAIFTTRVMPVMMIRMSDVDALDRHIDAFLDRNPDIVSSGIEIGDSDFRSMSVDGALTIDAGQVGDYAVVRIGIGSPDTDVTDEELASVLDGTPAGARFMDRSDVGMLLNRAGEREVSYVAFVESFAVSKMIETVFALLELDGDLSQLDAMGLQLRDLVYESDEHWQSCIEAAERFSTTMPWVGGVNFRDAEDPNHYEGFFVARFSAAGAEDMRSYFPGTVADARDNLDGAAVYAAAHPNFMAMYDGANGNPDHLSCPNLGAIPGAFAYLKQEESRWLEYNINFAEGAGALALYSIDFAGFLPNPNLAIMVGANDTVGMMEEIQEILEDSGGTGTVQTDASITTIDYRLMLYRMQLMMTEGRVVFSVGNVPRAILNTLASGDEGENFFEVSIDGEGLWEIIQSTLEYAQHTGVLDEVSFGQVEAAVAPYERIITYDIDGFMDGNDMVMEVDVQMAPREN